MVTEDKINVLIKAAHVNVDGQDCFQSLWQCEHWGSLNCNEGASGPAPGGGPAPSTPAAPAEEKKVEAYKAESKESNDDMGFGLFD